MISRRTCQHVTGIGSLKTSHNSVLPDILPQICHPDVLWCCYGMGDEAALLPSMTVDHLRLASCAHKAAPGHVVHEAYGAMRIGRWRPGWQAGEDQDAQHLEAILSTSGIHAQAVDDLLAARWSKLVWNVPFNGLCTLLDCSTQQLVNDDTGRDLVLGLMKEVQAGAAADGRTIEDAFIEKMMRDTEKMPPYAPTH